MKEKYERTKLDVIRFVTHDVIMTSGPQEYEDDIINSQPNNG